METVTITNPKTNRSCKVQAWNIDPRDVVAKFRDGTYKSAKDLSWALLSDRKSVAKMGREEGGDSGANNFALRVFETGLDWSLGLRVLQLIESSARRKCIPKPFQVAANRKGDVFVITHSGQVLA